MKACYHPIWYFLLFFLTTFYLQAQKAETIYPLTEVLHSVEYYKEQSQLWRTILDQNPQYENRFLKDDLLNPVGHDPSYTVVDHINWNYLPALTLLHEHYLSSGEVAQAKKVKKLAVNLACRAGRESAIADFFPPQFPKIKGPVNMDIKSLEKTLKPLGNGRHASATEVSNAEYELFLVSLLKEKEYRLINEFKAAPVDWISLIPEEYRNQPSEILFSNGHPNDPQAPVVNIIYLHPIV